MKDRIFILFGFITFISCSVTKPKDFTYKYSPNNQTELGKKIDLDGYYVVQRECDSTFNSIFMFYNDGLFVIATGTDLSEVEICFKSDVKSVVCDYPSWGIYKVEGDTIKTQTVQIVGYTGFTVFRDYVIQPDGSLSNLSDYVYPDNTKIGHLKKYPSFTYNQCPFKAKFVPLVTKRNKKNCPLLRLKWFGE